MPALIIYTFDEHPIKTEHARLETQFFHYNNCQPVRKSNSDFRDFMPALVTCKFDLSTSLWLIVRSWICYIFLVCILVFEANEIKFKPTKKNEGAIVSTAIFSSAQGQVTPKLKV